jgi:hypothetical protein
MGLDSYSYSRGLGAGHRGVEGIWGSFPCRAGKELRLCRRARDTDRVEIVFREAPKRIGNRILAGTCPRVGSAAIVRLVGAVGISR